MRTIWGLFIRSGVVLGTLFAALPAHAVTKWTVTGTGEAPSLGSINCTANSCPTLRDAINSAASGDTLVFDNALDGQTITLTLFSNNIGCVTSGPTACKTTGTLSTEFGPSAFFVTGGKTLTIDATQNGLTRGIALSAANGSGCTAGSCFRLFDIDSSSGLHLIGLTLSHGAARGGTSAFGGGALGAGGAIFNQGSLTLVRCTLSGNTAQGASTSSSSGSDTGGGGVGNDASMSNGNGGGPNGGAYNPSGTGDFGGFGGGGGTGEFADVAGGNGGFGGGGGLSYSTLSGVYGGSGGFGGGGGGGNTNPNPGGPGGFGGGSAYAQAGGAGAAMGGAIFNDAGTVSLINSTLSANAAQGGDGNDSGNASAYGGAIFNYMGSLTLDFVTVDENTVVAGNGPNSNSATGNADGGAIYMLGDSIAMCKSGGNVCSTNSATLTMNNSIAANSNGSTNDLVVNAINGGTSTSGGAGNLVMTQSGFSGTVASTANPQLNALIGGGGIWNVMVPKAGSGAIDAVACDGTATDQRGIARPYGTQCDIGSVEYNNDVFFVDGFEN